MRAIWRVVSAGAVTWSVGACVCLVAAMLAAARDTGVADGSIGGFVDILAAFALAPLLVSAWNTSRSNYGAAVAWTYVSLPIVVFSAVFALHFIRPSRLLGLVSCDAMANDCRPAPLNSWLPVVLFTACCVLLTVSIFISKATGRRV